MNETIGNNESSETFLFDSLKQNNKPTFIDNMKLISKDMEKLLEGR